MYRVVTKSLRICREGGRKLQVDLGPWQVDEDRARVWASYLEDTGLYDTVTVQSNGQKEAAAATQEDLSI